MENKSIVFSLISREGDSRSFVVDSARSKTLKPIIRRGVQDTAVIMTDSMRSYIGLDAEFAGHGVVDHTNGEYVRGILHTNFAESYFSLLKRGIIGTFHHVSSQHLQRHLDEFDFRWSSRDEAVSDRTKHAIRGAAGKRLMYRNPKN